MFLLQSRGWRAPWRGVRAPGYLILAGVLALCPGTAAGQRPDPAIDSLAARARSDSNDAVTHFELGRALLEAGRLDEAERVLRVAVELAPQYADAWLALGVLPERRGEGYWKRVQKTQGDSAVSRLWHESEACYRRAFLHDPLVSLRLLPRAEEKVSVRVGAYNLVVWWRQPLAKAFNALREEQYEDAIERLDKLVADRKAGPDGVWAPDAAYWYRGLAQAHLRRYGAAVNDFWRLVQRSLQQEQRAPETAVPLRTNEYRYMLATMLYLDGRYADAIKIFHRTLEHDAGLYQSHVQLARMYQQLDRWDESLAARRAAVATNPDDAGLLVDLGGTLLQMGRFAEARDQLQLAADLAPRDPRAPYLEALASLRLEDAAAAREAFTRFLAIAPSRYGPQVDDARQRLADLP